jgi:hypothetical protein
MNKREFLVALAFDVKGFFDNINHGRMTRTLQLYGFPPQLIGWTSSFLQDQKVAFRLRDFLSEQMDISNVGTPQGLPLLPVLSAIYTSPCWPDWDNNKFRKLQCYVDNGLIKVVGKDHKDAAKRATAALIMIKTFLSAVGLQIDRGDKLELMIFGRRGRLANNPSPPTVMVKHTDGMVSKVTVLQVWRYLGIWFTPTLNWTVHVTQMANKAIAQANALRMLANCIKGMTAKQCQMIYRTVVIPALLYTAAVYYTGKRQLYLVNILQN